MLCLAGNVIGQRLQPQGRFHTDSARIADEIGYSFWIEYQRDLDILFPDSLYDYSPFEYNRRDYFTTRSDSLLSYDSAVYYFSTFSIDSVQVLQLPVFLIEEGDSSVFFSSPDTIFLIEVVQEIPDSLDFRARTGYNEVNIAFNYPYLVVGVSAFVVLAIVLYVLFGKRIRKRLKLYRMSKTHKRFVEKFLPLINEKTINSEPALIVWKKYMERLERLPYTKLTTREILSFHKEKDLRESLRRIDRVIYANREDGKLPNSFAYLADYSDKIYEQKVEEIKNG